MHHKLIILLIFICINMFTMLVMSQPSLPSHNISVTAVQSLNFGTICLTGINGSGGEVTVDYQGIRTATSGIILMSMSPISQPAIFQIQLCQGRNIILEYSSVTFLTGSNGGTLTLNLGPSEYGPSGSQFSSSGDCNFINTLYMGGTLEIGSYSQNPDGQYSGTFEMTFNYE